MRSAVFDHIGREGGLALPGGTLGRRWQHLARASWPRFSHTSTGSPGNVRWPGRRLDFLERGGSVRPLGE